MNYLSPKKLSIYLCVIFVIVIISISYNPEKKSNASTSGTSLKLIKSEPVKYNENVAINDEIKLIFSEKIINTSIQPSSLIVYELGVGPVAGSLNVFDNTIIFLPDEFFKYASTYEIRIGRKIKSVSGAILSKNLLIPYATEQEPSDITPLNVISIHPNFSATSVTPNTIITVKFDKKISKLSVQNSNFNIKTIEGSVVPGQISFVANEISFKPVNNLKNNTTYYVIVGPDISDPAGNEMQDKVDWSFTTSKALPSQIDVPLLSKWEANMLSWGNTWGQHHDPSSANDRSAKVEATYYDAQYVFYQIADYTGEKEPWYTYAKYAGENYRNYLGNSFKRAAGYWRFPHGFYQDYTRDGMTTITEIRNIRDLPAFSHPNEFGSNTAYFGEWESVSRELAYAIQANVLAERAGDGRKYEDNRARLNTFIHYTEAQLNEWRTQTFSNPQGGRFSPFMFALTAHALIEFSEWEIENGRDPNVYWSGKYWPTIKDALIDLCNWSFNDARVRSGENAGKRMWVSSEQDNFGAFRYDDTSGGSNDIAYDLNMLIAPVYAWVYKETGDVKYRDMGDSIWGGGVNGACLRCLLGKVYNQNYRLSFDYLRWRNHNQ
jgi:hypothetical protein